MLHIAYPQNLKPPNISHYTVIMIIFWIPGYVYKYNITQT